MILAIDPGREKCGLAVLNASAASLEKKIVKRGDLEGEVVSLIAKYGVKTIVIGDAGDSKAAEKQLIKLDLKANIVFVPEKNSTLEARRRYWKENPPGGLLRLIPTSLIPLPRPVDDYAAVILGERYLKG